MNSKTIDILLPYWGEFSLFKKTVQSVLAQDHENWTMRVFDDHYPSLSAKEYCETLKDPRIVFVRHEKNMGITNNFNYAIDASTADYCVIIGCDDIMLPNYISNALANIGEADFYQPGVEIIDANDRVYLPLADKIKRIISFKKTGLYSGEKLASSLCVGNWLYFPSITWKTEVIKRYGFDKKYSIAQDVILEMNIIMNNGVLYLDNSTSFQYRRFSESLSSAGKSNGVRFREEKEVYEKLSTDFKKIGWDKASLQARLRITSRLHQFISKLK